MRYRIEPLLDFFPRIGFLACCYAAKNLPPDSQIFGVFTSFQLRKSREQARSQTGVLERVSNGLALRRSCAAVCNRRHLDQTRRSQADATVRSRHGGALKAS